MKRLLVSLLIASGLSLVSAPAAHAAVSVTVSASPATLVTGQTTSVRGKAVNARTGSVVKLQRRVSGTWRTLAQKKVGSTRTYAFTVSPPKGYQYYRVVKPAQLGQALATSPTVKVTVKTRPVIDGVSAWFGWQDGAPTMVVTGHVAPASYASVVRIQYWQSGAWHFLPHDPENPTWLGWTWVSSDGSFGAAVPRDTPQPLRVYKPAEPLYTAATAPVPEIGPAVTTATIGGPAVAVSTDGVRGRQMQVEFAGVAGDRIGAWLTHSGWSVTTALLDPQGNAVTSVSGKPVWDLPVSGTYRFTFTPTTDAEMANELRLLRLGNPHIIVLNAPPQTIETVHNELIRATVAATAGDELAFYSNAQSLKITDPDGIVAIIGPSQPQAHVTAKTGTYLIEIGPLGTPPSQVALAVSTPLVVDATLNGPPAQIGTGAIPGRIMRVRFPAAEGDIVDQAITSSNGPISSRLYRQGGPPLDYNRVAGAWLIQTSGFHYLEYWPDLSQWSGAVQLMTPTTFAVELNATPTPIAFGLPGQMTETEIWLEEGQRYSFAASQTGVAGVPDTYSIYVILPGGDRGERGGTWNQSPVHSLLATQSGVHRLVVNPGGQISGTAQFNISTPAAFAGSTTGPPVNLTTGQIPGRQMRLSFQGSAGSIITESMLSSSTGWDASGLLALFSPYGEVHSESAGVTGGIPSRRYWVLPIDATYYFVYAPLTLAPMSATVSINANLSAVGSVGAPPLNVTFSRPGQAVLIDVPLTGDPAWLTVNVANLQLNGPPNVTYRVISALGNRLGDFESPTGSYTVPIWQPGTVKVLVLAGATTSGSLELTFAQQ